MKGLKLHVIRLFSIGMALWLAACGGGGSDGDGTASNATITGTVAGTTIVAYDADNNQVASVVATGTGTKSFSLTVPAGDIYKFYFIENENSATERVLPLYVGGVNLFFIDSGTTIDLGFVDTTTDVAVPTYSPLDVDGVSSGGEEPTLPLSLGFAGTYSIVTEYENNISSGVALSERSDLVAEISRQDDTHFTLLLTDSGPGSYTVPLVRAGQVARIASSPLDVGDGYLLEFTVLSDGANMAALMIGQEYSDPSDISFILSNWVRDSVVVTADDFAGTWNAAIQEISIDSPVFTESSLTISITSVDTDTITVNFRGDVLTLDIVDGRATLVGAPVVIGSKMYHSLSIRTDGEGLSFYEVETALDTLTGLSVELGLATKS
jgi:hypothetical protein